MAPRDLHLTLHFLGAVPRARLPELVEAVTTTAGGRAPFVLAPGRAAVWSNGVAVLELDASPALAELHAALGAALRALGLRTEARRWRPHVTVARRALGALAPAGVPRARWPVAAVAVVESQAPRAGGYRVLGRAPLGGVVPAVEAPA